MATTITEHAPTRRTSRGASATVAGAKTKTRQRGRSARTKQDLYQRRRHRFSAGHLGAWASRYDVLEG